MLIDCSSESLYYDTNNVMGAMRPHIGTHLRWLRRGKWSPVATGCLQGEGAEAKGRTTLVLLVKAGAE